MKRLRVPARGFSDSTGSSDASAGSRSVGVFVARDAIYHYVARVHRLGVGDVVTLFDPDRRVEADADVIAVGRDEISFHVSSLRDGLVHAERSVRVVQGLPKGDKLDAIVRDATELGASELWLCETERAVATAPEAGRLAKKLARLERIAEEAARQSGRSDVPRIVPPRSLRECLAADTSERRVLLTPHAERSAGSLLRAEGSVTFYVGPEGGFSESEQSDAERAGVSCATLGGFVLRTETVVAAVLGALRLLER